MNNTLFILILIIYTLNVILNYFISKEDKKMINSLNEYIIAQEELLESQIEKNKAQDALIKSQMKLINILKGNEIYEEN